jgi:hypothetical protein
MPLVVWMGRTIDVLLHCGYFSYDGCHVITWEQFLCI